jgi:hypothetical protein
LKAQAFVALAEYTDTRFREGNEILMAWLPMGRDDSPFLLMFSETLGEGIGLVSRIVWLIQSCRCPVAPSERTRRLARLAMTVATALRHLVLSRSLLRKYFTIIRQWRRIDLDVQHFPLH